MHSPLQRDRVSRSALQGSRVEGLPSPPLRRLDSNEKRERALAVLEHLGLGGKASHLPNQLSGGEQGRAIVNEPPLVLADEPTGTLDTKTGEEIMEVFLKLNEQGQTIFMVTHNPDNAASTHRTVHIRDGALAHISASSNQRPLRSLVRLG